MTIDSNGIRARALTVAAILAVVLPSAAWAQTRDGRGLRERPGGRGAGPVVRPPPGGYRCFNIVGRPYRSSRPCGIS